MNCIVTAGPTYEPLDHVRRLTNFSTGRLGIELAAFLAGRDHEVTLLVSEQATHSGTRRAGVIETFTTTRSLSEKLQGLAGPGIDAVFHAAAVSDFMFGKIWVRSPKNELTEVKSGKIRTRQGILLAELIPTPKIIGSLRDWFPKAKIVGWKYEVDGDRNDVTQAAEKQISQCLTDGCVANGPAYGDGFGLVGTNGKAAHLVDIPALFGALARLVNG